MAPQAMYLVRALISKWGNKLCPRLPKRHFCLSVCLFLSVIHISYCNTIDVPSCHSLLNYHHNYRLSQCASCVLWGDELMFMTLSDFLFPQRTNASDSSATHQCVQIEDARTLACEHALTCTHIDKYTHGWFELKFVISVFLSFKWCSGSGMKTSITT